MKKIIVNGNGWSGSSAFIHLLENTFNPNYILVPGEFDDFRAPGALRNLLTSNDKPQSYRRTVRYNKYKFLLRSLFKDKYWLKSFPGQNIPQRKAKLMFNIMNIEDKAFKNCLTRSQESISQKENLRIWFDELSRDIGKLQPNSDAIFFEQLLFFDDDPKLYDWLNFDKLILFIRHPNQQLSATRESKVLYDGFSWPCEFLIGGPVESYLRKYEVYIDTTIQRYEWTLKFLNFIDPSKICIINFDTFLYEFKKSISFLEKFLSIDLEKNLQNFSIEDSIKRDNSWDINTTNLKDKLDFAEKEFYKFQELLKSKYEFI